MEVVCRVAKGLLINVNPLSIDFAMFVVSAASTKSASIKSAASASRS